MDNRTNTIAGWVLAGCGAALALSIVGGMVFEGHKPEKAGYPVEAADDAGGGDAAAPEVPIATLLPHADAAKGADVFKKCAACHTINQGGPAGIGPNLYAIIGDAIAKGRGGYPFSDALGKVGGNWDFDKLNAWLTSPRKFAPGTKMTFAGLSNPQDRANVILYLNSQGSNLPLPSAPAAATTDAKQSGATKAAEKAATTGSPTADLANSATPASGAPSLDKAAAVRGERVKDTGK